jgi:hypothetical protein
MSTRCTIFQAAESDGKKRMKLMKDYNIFIDGWVDPTHPDSAPNYQIAISPSSRDASAMATKQYQSQDALEADLRTYFGFTDAGIKTFAKLDFHQALIHPLSDEVVAYFGWHY